MSKLTEKQLSFAQNIAAGVKQREAAIAAGYAPSPAAVTASNLMARSDIKAAVARFKREHKSGVTTPPDVDEGDLDNTEKRNKMPRAKYDDPIVFLTDLMNHKHIPLAMRADAAKQLLPYKHARIAEKGKKDTKVERAKAIAGGGVKSKFATKTPPPLKLVNGGKT